ncbi:MAG: serine/threonine protein kinase [Euryarchaeota archaeon]|nr:serine/threonine protein kinase [Euryarchaeota archaeon]
MTSSDAVIWGAFALFNLFLAWLVGAVKPRRLANFILATMLAFNGLFAVKECVRAAGVVLTSVANNAVDVLVTVPTFVAFIVLPFFFPKRLLSRRGELVLLGFGGLMILVNTALILNDPTSLLNAPTFPLFAATAYAWFFVGVVVGSLLLLNTYLRSPSPLQQNQALFLLGAYVLKLAVALAIIVDQVVQHNSSWPHEYPMNVAYMFLLAFPLAAVLVALISSRVRGTGANAPRDGDWFLVALIALGATLYLAGYVVKGDLLPLEYMIIRPFLLAFAMLRYQMMEVDLQERRPVVAACLIAGFVAIALLSTRTLVAVGLEEGPAAVLGFMSTLVAALALSWPLVRLLVNRSQSAGATGRELYQAALAETIAARTGHSTANDRVLRALRERLQISDREHASMNASVEAASRAHSTGSRPKARAVSGREGLLTARRIGWPRSRARLMREARLLGRIAHPNIVTIYDVEVVGDSCFLVMEYLEGGSLSDRLKEGPLTLTKSLPIMDEVLQALGAAHAEGIVHRDVKPANILLTRSGRAKLADFGVARMEPGSGTLSGASFAEGHAGSLLFMSPEQVRGTAVDRASDLYSFGAVWFEVLTGRHYLDLPGRADFDMRLAILEEKPRLPIPRLPANANQLLADLLAKDSAARPASVTVVRRRLRLLVPRTRGA